MANIAVFGGTFNPFHKGHYQMLECVCGLEIIDRVLLMPDKIPPHKTCDFLADNADRIKMCELVCEDFDKAELCLIEFEREGKSYSADTIKLLKTKYPSDKFYMVIGGDMLATLDSWYKWQELIKDTEFIAFDRDGMDNFEHYIKRMQNLGAEIIAVDKKIISVSSTQLRENLNKNLLPEKVYNYIIKKGIYNE